MTDEERGLTEKEVHERLRSDPSFLDRLLAHDETIRANVRRNLALQAPVIHALNSIGYDVRSLDELRRSGTPYRDAVPVLVEWLERTTDPNLKNSIVRALSVPWARPYAVPHLVRAFWQSQPPLRWVIGNALSVVADDSVFDQIAQLVKDPSFGKSREMLALALANMKDPRAIDVLIQLLGDEQVAGHAVMALGKIGAERARSSIEPLLSSPRSWIRNEAKKALRKIDNKHNKSGQ